MSRYLLHILLGLSLWGQPENILDISQPGPYAITDSIYDMRPGEPDYEATLIYPKNWYNRPLILIFHANGQWHYSYRSVQRHLASHGFITASISRSDWKNILSYLLNPSHPHIGSRINNDLMVMGHSIGGMVVMKNLSYIKDQGFNIRSTVLAAPAPRPHLQDLGLEGMRQSLNGLTDSLLVFYSSMDEDVKGEKEGDIVPSGFIYYDQAGNEGHTASLNVPVKDFVYAYGTGGHHHAIRSSDTNTWVNNNAIDGEEDRFERISGSYLGYLTAHAYLHVYGRLEFDTYFKYGQQPDWVADPSTFKLQHQSKRKRVIANFEGSNPNQNHLGGSIQHNLIYQRGLAFEKSNYSPHVTRAALFTWVDDSQYIRFNIPENFQDLTSFSHLTFRVAQRHDSTLNPLELPQDFRVVIGDGIFESSVFVSDYVDIPYADLTQPVIGTRGSILDPPGDWDPLPRNPMVTVTIPLSDFSLPKGRIDKVSFQFNVTGHHEGSILVDNLELTRKFDYNNQLDDGRALGSIRGYQGQMASYFTEVPWGWHRVSVETEANNGDADLYVSTQSKPDRDRYEFRSISPNSNENIAFVNSGNHFVYSSLYGYSSFSDLVLRVTTEDEPCDNCLKETGFLPNGQVSYHPYDNYYYTSFYGVHEAWLEGPESESHDFDLELFKWDYFSNSWVSVAQSLTPNTLEHVRYEGSPGYFIWRVASFEGSSNFQLWTQRP